MSDLLALVCLVGAAYVLGVGHGRWKAATWEARMRAWAAAVTASEERKGERRA